MGICETSEHRTWQKKTAGAIVRYAEENHADVIVFEYLEMQERYRKEKARLLWRKRDIQRRCMNIRHTGKEMRISRISVHGIPADWLMMVRGGNT